MDKNELGESTLWEYINQNQITLDKVTDLKGFKSSPVNWKISLWNPQFNGARYLKALIYNLCTQITRENWARLRQIRNRDVGDPISISFNRENVCLDYVQAVYELEFLATRISLDDKVVLEIGAGYGRTCHAILSNFNVIKYTIVDLSNCLELARTYLKAVLDDYLFNKIVFIAVEDIGKIEFEYFDVCINIDSFSEMNAKTVYAYLRYIDTHCHNFYVKNPVGKYLDKSLDDHSQGDELVSIALSTGILCDVIDIHDNQVVLGQREKFISAYCPSIRWHCTNDAWAAPWSYYWQAFYTIELENNI